MLSHPHGTIDKSTTSLQILVQPYLVHLAQHPPKTPIPATAFQADLPFLSITRTLEEITLLFGIETTALERDEDRNSEKERMMESLGLGKPVNEQGPYSALKIRGPLDLCNSLNLVLRIELIHSDDWHIERNNNSAAFSQNTHTCCVDLVRSPNVA